MGDTRISLGRENRIDFTRGLGVDRVGNRRDHMREWRKGENSGGSDWNTEEGHFRQGGKLGQQ